MTQPNGIHHVAFMAADIKKHIAFFSEVMGCPLVALFDMHGVPGGLHAFLRLNEASYFSIVQLPEAANIPIQIGVTHAGRGENPCAPGALQHIAFGAANEAELMAMRDRIRSKGVNVIGPLDHGFCKSIYFAGPDSMALEVAAPANKLIADEWIDPAVLKKAGISGEEAAQYRAPEPYAGPSPVSQPAYDASKPHMPYPAERYKQMLAAPDDVVTKMSAQYAKPPVSA